MLSREDNLHAGTNTINSIEINDILKRTFYLQNTKIFDYMINAILNNISVISHPAVLLVEEIGVIKKKHPPTCES